MLPLLFQVPPLTPGTDPLVWIAGLLAGACAFLGRELLKRADAELAEWKSRDTTSTASLHEALTALRSINDAVADSSRETTAAITTYGQAVIEQGRAVTKLSEDVRTVVALITRNDTRLTHLETDRQPPAERAP